MLNLEEIFWLQYGRPDVPDLDRHIPIDGFAFPLTAFRAMSASDLAASSCTEAMSGNSMPSSSATQSSPSYMSKK
jgi:hypothetical protein